MACVTYVHSFLWLNNVLLYVYTTFCLSVHLSMDTLIVSTFWLLWIVPQWTLTYTYLFESVFNSFEHIYQGVELLGHMVILCLPFWGAAKLLFTAVEPFYILTSNVQEFQFLHILINVTYQSSIACQFSSTTWCSKSSRTLIALNI